MKISVVIPVYNEQDNITHVIGDIRKRFGEPEIIIVNDASTDQTLPLLQTMHVSNLTIITNTKNRGHGYSVIKGLLNATGEYIMYIDADRQIGLETIGFEWDIISGCRVGRYDKLFRKIISFCLKMTILFRYGYYVRDANCPFKIYKRASLLPLIDLLPRSYIIPIACLEVLARKHHLKTLTVPTPHFPYPNGERTGKLQSLNKVSILFFWNAFLEIITL